MINHPKHLIMQDIVGSQEVDFNILILANSLQIASYLFQLGLVLEPVYALIGITNCSYLKDKLTFLCF